MSATRRLFFCLELPKMFQQEIVCWRADNFAMDTGRPVAAANLHLTLAFLGDVSEPKQNALMTLAGRIRQPSFSLRLDDAGHWLRSRVVWLGLRRPPRGLLQLANLLRAQAAHSGCHQRNGEFHPHITLYRHACTHTRLPPPGFSLELEVNDFVLCEADYARGSGRYRALARWPLQTLQ